MELNEPFENEDAEDGLDLTPRTGGDGAAGAGSGRGSGGADGPRRWIMGGVLAVIVAVLGVVAWQGLSNAAVYFRNADEAVAERDELGTRRFRLQGAVVAGSVEPDGTLVRFAVEHGGVTVAVVHEGDPPDLFQPEIPVVLEGRWSATSEVFESDRILVKHSADYEADNPDRVDEYVGEDDAASSGAENG